jgi:hypothetical protein
MMRAFYLLFGFGILDAPLPLPLLKKDCFTAAFTCGTSKSTAFVQ